MSDPEQQASPEFREAVARYLDRQDPSFGLVFLFFCLIYIAVFFTNVMVFKRLFGYQIGKKPMKTYQTSSANAAFSNVINALIILVLVICLGFIIFFLVNYGEIGRTWLAIWSMLLLMFIRPPVEYYAFYTVIATGTKYDSQYKFESNAKHLGKSRMIFWGAAVVAKEVVLYLCHGYISSRYPDSSCVIVALSAAIVLVGTLVSLHVLLFVSVRLQWKMFRGKIVVTYMDKFMFSQIMLLAIFKTALILVVLLAMLTGSDTLGSIQCYYTTDILVVATVFLLSEVLSAERNSEGRVYVDPDGGVEESKI